MEEVQDVLIAMPVLDLYIYISRGLNKQLQMGEC